MDQTKAQVELSGNSLPEDGFHFQSAPHSFLEVSVYDTPKTSRTSDHARRRPELSQDLLIVLQKCAAELISTFILVFAGCGAVVVDVTSKGQVTHVGVALAWGLVVTILVYAVAHISGCHINPAVSIALASIGEMKWTLLPLYILSQCVGAISAGFALRATFAHGHHGFSAFGYLGATYPSGGDAAQSFVLEILTTFILMFVVTGVATDPRAAPGFGGLAVGGAIALDAMFAGPISGASMNPARSLGPAVAAGYYKKFWVYIFGPIIGALGGAWAYVMIRVPPTQVPPPQCITCKLKNRPTRIDS